MARHADGHSKGRGAPSLPTADQTTVARKAGLSNHAITTLANGGIPEESLISI
jgi:hypothetical protein